MKISLLLATALWLTIGSATHAETVELTGLACLAGEKMALLVMYPSAGAEPVHFTLAEGEAEHGIKLVQVDAAQHRVEIEQDGVKRVVSLCGTAAAGQAGNIPVVVANETISTEEARKINGWLRASGERMERLKADATAGGLAGAGSSSPTASKNQTGNQSGSQSGSTANGTGSGSGTDSGGKVDATKEAWYQESLAIEESRIATVNDVLAGDATPWPRTPLTPANTPARLVGKETFFSNHIPHYIVPGYMESLATGN